MKKMVLLGLLAWSCLYGGVLTFESGVIKAHTEVFGDNTIDPMTNKMSTDFIMGDDPKTLRGSARASMMDLISDNKKRDEHMRETLDCDKFHQATFEIKEVLSKGGDNYTLKGTMNLHGITKPMSFESMIIQEGSKVRIKATGMIKMSDYGITPPKMVLLTVRDQVDVSVDLVLKR